MLGWFYICSYIGVSICATTTEMVEAFLGRVDIYEKNILGAERVLVTQPLFLLPFLRELWEKLFISTLNVDWRCLRIYFGLDVLCRCYNCWIGVKAILRLIQCHLFYLFNHTAILFIFETVHSHVCIIFTQRIILQKYFRICLWAGLVYSQERIRRIEKR